VIAVVVERFDQWRDQARTLLRDGVAPEEVHWTGQAGSLFETRLSSGHGVAAPRVPKAFIPLAEAVSCYRDDERWNVLYRVLWRINQGEPHLLEIASDSDVLRLRRMAGEVNRDVHKMHAFVRFRKIQDGEGRELYVAWHEPTHLIVERATPFFARRFDSVLWSILTPDRCAYWDGQDLRFGPGLTRAHAPSGDAMEDLWKTYYRNIFNPARVKLSAMKAEMPKKYWRTMPETAVIAEMLGQAEARVETMLEHGRVRREGSYPADATAELMEGGGSLKDLASLASGCQACELFERASGVVFGEGPATASLMLVGEQPGDQEDLQGRPFIGPAGQLLRRTLSQAGANVDDVYFTNTVKHFHWVPSPNSGKRRLHQRANLRQISTCQGWLTGEIALIKPRVLVCLGATAGQALLGPTFRIGRDRGRWLESALAPRVMATVHPSFLLRISEPEEKERQIEQFLADLQLAVAAAQGAC
jgi:DNA polymerase